MVKHGPCVVVLAPLAQVQWQEVRGQAARGEKKAKKGTRATAKNFPQLTH